jgi:hypothetical protein
MVPGSLLPPTLPPTALRASRRRNVQPYRTPYYGAVQEVLPRQERVRALAARCVPSSSHTPACCRPHAALAASASAATTPDAYRSDTSQQQQRCLHLQLLGNGRVYRQSPLASRAQPSCRWRCALLPLPGARDWINPSPPGRTRDASSGSCSGGSRLYSRPNDPHGCGSGSRRLH